MKSKIYYRDFVTRPPPPCPPPPLPSIYGWETLYFASEDGEQSCEWVHGVFVVYFREMIKLILIIYPQCLHQGLASLRRVALQPASRFMLRKQSVCIMGPL